MNAEITFEMEGNRCIGTWKLYHNNLMYGNKISVPAEYEEDLVLVRILAENLLDSVVEIEKQTTN